LTLHEYLLIGLLSGAFSGIIGANFVLFAIIGEINRRLPELDRISYLFGHYEKYRHIFNEYRRLYPNGRLLLWFKLLLCLGFGLLAIFAWQFGMFG
jgi:hypothetical protein